MEVVPQSGRADDANSLGPQDRAGREQEDDTRQPQVTRQGLRDHSGSQGDGQRQRAAVEGAVGIHGWAPDADSGPGGLSKSRAILRPN